MLAVRPSTARLRRFGRRTRPAPDLAPELALEGAPGRLGDELRLFALTFAGGFLFMTVYLA